MASLHKHVMALQAELDTITEPARRKLVANIGVGVINLMREPVDSQFAWASRAYFLKDGTEDSFLHPFLQFGEVITRGHVPQVESVSVGFREVIALPFRNAVVLGPRQDVEAERIEQEMAGSATVLPLDTPLPRPLYLPVEALLFSERAA